MKLIVGLLFLAATCYAQEASQPDAVQIQSSQTNGEVANGEREPFFFVTLTITITSTVSTSTTTVLSTASTCTSLSSTTACSGKRRRRGIMMNDEEYFADKIIRPTAVAQVEATAAPVAEIEPKREAREADPQYFYDGYYPAVPSFVPYSPKINPFFNVMAPYFRQGQVVPNVYHPDQRFLFSFTTSLSTTFTSTSTSTSYTTTITQVLLCSAASSFSACPASG